MKNLLILLFIVGCASNGNREKDLEEITNEDFQRAVPVSYSAGADHYSEVSAKDASALNDETLFRLSDYSGSVKDGDVVTRITQLCYEKNYEEALALVNAEYERYRENPSFWNQVGSCYLLQGQNRKALLFYNKALEFEKDYAPAFNNIGVLYRMNGEDQRAEVAFKSAVSSSAFSKTPRFNLAQLYLSYGLYGLAIENFKVLESSGDVEVLAGLGSAFLMAGSSSQATGYFKRIEEKYYRKPFIGINAALAYYASGDRRVAQSALRQVNEDDLGELKGYYNQVKEKIGL